MGACEVEHGLEVSEGAVSAYFPLSRRENAHEALHEGVGEKAFPGGEDAVEVLGEGPGELGHGCEQGPLAWRIRTWRTQARGRRCARRSLALA